MGAWGFFSDENDGTHDILPIDFGARLGGSAPIPAAERTAQSRNFNKLLNKLPASYKKIKSGATARFLKQTAEYSEAIPKNLLGLPNTVFAGAVMWGLKQGLHLNKAHVQLAKQQLQFELEQLQAGIDVNGWRDPKKRIVALHQELADLAKALKAGFGVSRSVRGIGSRRSGGRPPERSRKLRARRTKRFSKKSRAKRLNRHYKRSKNRAKKH